MSRLDSLPPDQRAALALLLRQQRDYAEVARLLRIREQAVHDRAHAALAVLAPREARELPAERRLEVGDYLLGQRSSVADSLRTRSYLDASPQARKWAKAIAAELAPLSAGPLPEIPGAAPSGNGGAPAASEAAATEPAADGGAGGSPLRDAAQALPSSRRAGAVLLAALAIAVGLGIAALAGAFSGSSHPRSARSAGSGATGAAANATAPKATEGRRITLRPPNPASKAAGVAQVLYEGNQYAFYLAAEHLPPSKGKGFFYAVWLYNSPTSAEALSRSPDVGANGRLQGGALLPADAARYRRMVLTRETSERPTRPGPIVLSGAFGLR
jgi:hypothetical protein